MPTGHNAKGIDALGGTHMPAEQTIMQCQDQSQACNYASYLCYPTSVSGMHIGGQTMIYCVMLSHCSIPVPDHFNNMLHLPHDQARPVPQKGRKVLEGRV